MAGVVLILVYVLLHYLFVSQTAHLLALFGVFLGVGVKLGVPPALLAFQLLFATNIGHSRVETSAAEVWQVFGVRRATNKQTLARVFVCNFLEYQLPQLRIKFRAFNLLPQLN